MDIIGAVVLIDPATGQPYKADGTNAPGTGPYDILGSVVLIDPTTKQPYKIGS